jgi:hypothetical protein
MLLNYFYLIAVKGGEKERGKQNNFIFQNN